MLARRSQPAPGDDPAMTTRYEPNWRSLREHRTPRWFSDAKFGIYTHWGIYSVPAFGPNATWYPYRMYREGEPHHAHHLKTYGHPSEFGYKDFIPEFTGAKFDADEWADLVQARRRAVRRAGGGASRRLCALGQRAHRVERGPHGAEAGRGG